MLSDEDKRHIEAAQGWFELGLHAEAGNELENIPLHGQQAPAVLCIRWQICFAAGDWDGCLNHARALLDAQPGSPISYNFISIALHKLGRTREAWEMALPALERFPEDWQIAYNLACYAAQLSNHEKAMALLRTATRRGPAAGVKFHALEDPDLKPIWKQITTQLPPPAGKG